MNDLGHLSGGTSKSASVVEDHSARASAISTSVSELLRTFRASRRSAAFLLQAAEASSSINTIEILVGIYSFMSNAHHERLGGRAAGTEFLSMVMLA